MDADDHFEFDDFSWRRAPVLLADRLGLRPIWQLDRVLMALDVGKNIIDVREIYLELSVSSGISGVYV